MGANLSELGRRLPQIALAFLAAKQGGPEAVAGLQAGISAAEQRQQALQRQAQLDEERRQLQAAQEARMQSADMRAGAADARAEEDQRLQRANSLIAALSQYDADPSGLASLYGVPSEQAAAIAAPIVTARDKKRANDLLASLERSPLYKGYFQSPETLAELDEQNIVWKGAPIKIRELRTIAEQTVAPKAVTANVDVPNTPEEQFYQQYAAERGAKSFSALPTAEQAKARKQWMQADDRPSQPPVQRYSRATMMDADGNAVEVNFDALSGKYTDPDTGRVLTGLKPPPSGLGGLGGAANQLRNQRTAAALNSVEKLKSLAPVRVPGPAGIAQGAGEVVKGYLGYSTKTRQFQALIQPTAMQMAAAIQGAANLSDNERKAMAEMLGSINTMDYESQMALLDSASELLQHNADVQKVGNTWVTATRAIKLAPGQADGVRPEVLPRERGATPVRNPFRR